MRPVRVSTVIDAPRRRVWADLRDIASHAEWMDDAESIRITSPSATGVGTTFECATKVGPIRLSDRMEVTEWAEGRAMAIRHLGRVTGTGRFSLRRAPRGRTRFTWEERLVFPWWLGGPLGSFVAGHVLRRIWVRNVRNLKRRLEKA